MYEKRESNMSIDQVIATWVTEENEVCTRLIAPGIASKEQLAGLSGMEFLERISAGELPPAPIGDTLDFVPIRIEPGFAIFQGRPKRKHYNPLGTVHGGWFATLLDTAVGCAVYSTLPAGKGFTTLDLNIKIKV
jgi:hypothetical protein